MFSIHTDATASYWRKLVAHGADLLADKQCLHSQSYMLWSQFSIYSCLCEGGGTPSCVSLLQVNSSYQDHRSCVISQVRLHYIMSQVAPLSPALSFCTPAHAPVPVSLPCCCPHWCTLAVCSIKFSSIFVLTHQVIIVLFTQAVSTTPPLSLSGEFFPHQQHHGECVGWAAQRYDTCEYLYCHGSGLVAHCLY